MSTWKRTTTLKIRKTLNWKKNQMKKENTFTGLSSARFHLSPQTILIKSIKGSFIHSVAFMS